jgi:6-pyruvoyltetrahydropterin/6-carboxytetrahydropterin synthase
MIIILSKDFDFESAQALPQFPAGHKCRNVHGHSFKITISVRGPVDEASGIFYDHAAISDAMRPLVEQLDHAYLNDVPGLENPTIENMARWFWERLHLQLPGLYEITLHETPRARCTYRGEQA